MPDIGKCKLCNNQKDLQLFHAVGDSVFKKIFRINSGKAISITSGDDDIGYSSDSWAEQHRYSQPLLINNILRILKDINAQHLSNLDLNHFQHITC